MKRKYKIGQRYRMTEGTYDCKINENTNDIIVITNITDRISFTNETQGHNNYFFSPCRMEDKMQLITETKENTNMKYILLKDTPDFKAGEVFEKRTPKARNYTALSNDKTLPCSTVENNAEWFEIQEDFKAGDHVVVTDFGSLSSMAGPEFLLETVYVLAENFDEENGFIVELDNSGNTDNGWSAGFSKIKLRKATSAEIVKYNKANAEEKAIRVKLGKSGYTSTIEEDKGEYQIAFGCKKLKVHQLEAIKTIMELFDNEFRTGDNISLRINNERITLLPDDNDESIEDLEYVEWKGDDVSSESIDKFIQILKAKNKK